MATYSTFFFRDTLYFIFVKQLAVTSKSTNVVIDDKWMVRAVLNGIASIYETLISAFNALCSDGLWFSYNSVQSLLFQEEQGDGMKRKLSEAFTLLAEQNGVFRSSSGTLQNPQHKCIDCGH